MRKLAVTALTMALAGAPLVFAAEDAAEINTSNYSAGRIRVVRLQEMTREKLEAFFTGKTPEVALECPQGIDLPLNLLLKGDLELASCSPLNLKILNGCTIRCLGDDFLFSSDGQNWRSFHEFFTGVISFSLNTEGGRPEMDLSIELNRRA